MYKPLSQNDRAEDVLTGPRDGSKSQSFLSSRLKRYSPLLLAISIFMNLLQSFFLFSPSKPTEAPSLYANLYRNVPVPFTRDTAWSDANRSVADALWEQPGLDGSLAVVSVGGAWAARKGLPSAQRWPWDRSRAVYVVNAVHNFHCLKSLREQLLAGLDANADANDGAAAAPQPYSTAHMLHCLDVLREDIMCNADDTLRYTGRLHDQADARVPDPGVGQARMCRDWDGLVRWIGENSACYRPIPDNGDPDFDERERYKFCPDGKTYWD